MTTDEVIQQKGKEFVDQILEHADSVRIFITFHQADTTKSFNIGGGNFYAQLGLVGEWVTRQNEISRSEERKNHD